MPRASRAEIWSTGGVQAFSPGCESPSPAASSDAVRAATAPRSDLFTANTSGSSRTPAFMNCSMSPAPGWAR
jgi:hypothetical protein